MVGEILGNAESLSRRVQACHRDKHGTCRAEINTYSPISHVSPTTGTPQSACGCSAIFVNPAF